MEPLRPETLRTHVTRGDRWRSHLWHEWCFLRAVLVQRGLSLVLLVVVTAAVGILVRTIEPDKHPSLADAMYVVWSMIFGQPAQDFPDALLLRILYFALPVLGITVIIEAVVEIARMIRDRQHNALPWSRIMATSMKDHVVLVGLGRVGFKTWLILRRLGHPVAVIESRADAQFLDDVRRAGTPIFIGDARREAWLIEANIAHAKSIVVATDNDLANLEIALDARRINPKVHVVMRMFDPEMAEKVREGFGIRTVMSAAALAAPAFAVAAVTRDIVSSVVVDAELIVTLRWSIDAGSALEGRTVGDLMRDHSIGVLEHRAKGAAPKLIPAPETRFSAGDRILVQAALDVLERHPLGASAS